MNKSIRLQWKSFKIHMPQFVSKAIALVGDKYLGATADNEYLSLLFSPDADDNKMKAVIQHWDSLDESGEASKFDLDRKVSEAIAVAKSRIPYENLGSLTTAEKKVLMSLDLTDEDRAELILKYQVK